MGRNFGHLQCSPQRPHVSQSQSRGPPELQPQARTSGIEASFLSPPHPPGPAQSLSLALPLSSVYICHTYVALAQHFTEAG